jgi:hypothetical protein
LGLSWIHPTAQCEILGFHNHWDIYLYIISISIEIQTLAKFSLDPFRIMHDLSIIAIAGGIGDFISSSFVKQPYRYSAFKVKLGMGSTC